MKTKNTDSILQNNTFRVALVTAGILMIPVFGRWPWGIGDFIAMGILIFGFGNLLVFTAGKFSNPIHRALVCIAVVGMFFVIWAELAVDAVSQFFYFLSKGTV